MSEANTFRIYVWYVQYCLGLDLTRSCKLLIFHCMSTGWLHLTAKYNEWWEVTFSDKKNTEVIIENTLTELLLSVIIHQEGLSYVHPSNYRLKDIEFIILLNLRFLPPWILHDANMYSCRLMKKDWILLLEIIN